MLSRRAELVLALLFLLACGAVDRLGFEPVDIDSHSYIDMARGVIAKSAFVVSRGDGGYEVQFTRTPGYPAFLALPMAFFGEETGLRTAVWLQRVLWAWLVVFLLPPCCGRRETAGQPGTSRLEAALPLAGKALALFLPLVLLTASAVLSEVLFTVLLFTGVRATARAGGWEGKSGRGWSGILAGLCFGAATLVRPVGLWLPLLAVLTTLVWQILAPAAREGTAWIRARRTILPLLPVLVIGLAVPALWMLRNRHLSGHFALASIDGPTFALHRQAALRTLPEEVAAALPPAQQAFVGEVRQHGDVYWATAQVRNRFALDEFEASRTAFAAGIAAMKAAPAAWLKTTLVNVVNTFTSPAEGMTFAGLLAGRSDLATASLGQALAGRDLLAVALHALLRGGQLLFLVLVPAVLLWKYRQRVREDLLLWLLLVSAAYLTLGPALVTISYGRFLFPAVPALASLYTLPASGRRGPAKTVT